MDFKGAEAEVTISENQVVKKRKEKNYRHPELDNNIREERTKTEARILEKARQNGVNVPEVLETSETVIKMEKLEGPPIKQILEENTSAMKTLGVNVAQLHDADVIHGDLTTSNALNSEDVHLIDFGLSFHSDRIEDKAVDIHLLKQVLNSSHPGIAEECWTNFVEGYRDYDESDKVLEKLEEVEKRGRYK